MHKVKEFDHVQLHIYGAIARFKVMFEGQIGIDDWDCLVSIIQVYDLNSSFYEIIYLGGS